jgi:hypothetical protein
MTESECQASMARNRDRIAAWRAQNAQVRDEAKRKEATAEFWRAVDQQAIKRQWTELVRVS